MNPIALSFRRKVRRSKTLYIAIMSMLATSFMLFASPANAQSAVSLGQAESFAVFAGGGITNSGATTVQGDIGTYPTVSYYDTGTVTLTGSYHFGDATAVAAKTDLASAYSAAASATATTNGGAELGGQTLTPGVYSSASGLGVHGTLTLDAQNNPNAVFIIKTAGDLSTGASSQVNIVNGGQACNVFWQVGTTTDLGANSDFKGTVLGNSNVTAAANAKVLGRLLANNGSVALNSDTITKPVCATPSPVTLYVVPDSQSVTYGSSPLTFTAKYETVNNNVATAIANPALGNPGWVAPVCNTTPAYTATTPVGTLPITCTGGNGGTLYTLDKTDTATLTVTKVGSKVTITTYPSGVITAGNTLYFNAAVSPVSGQGVCTGSATFSLDKNPVTGAVGAYTVTSPVLTTNWMPGNYNLTASYAGDSNCLPSVSSATVISVGTPIPVPVPSGPVVVKGEGSYLSPFGPAKFELELKANPYDTSTAQGEVHWMVPGQWKFEGTLNSYSFANGIGTATGTGQLWYWSGSSDEGNWVAATTGPTQVTVKFTVGAKMGDDEEEASAITSFAIGFSGTPAVGAPALPVLGDLVAVNNGEEGNNGEHNGGNSNGEGHNNGNTSGEGHSYGHEHSGGNVSVHVRGEGRAFGNIRGEGSARHFSKHGGHRHHHR